MNSIDLTQAEEITEDTSEGDSQSAMKEEQLDDVHIDILKILALSPSPLLNLSNITLEVKRPKTLVGIKLKDLVNRAYVYSTGQFFETSGFKITDRGARFLDSEGLL